VLRELAEACWQAERSEADEAPCYEDAALDAAWAGHLAPHPGPACERPIQRESFAQGLTRVRRVHGLIDEWLGAGVGSALVVTHGHFLRELLRLRLGAPDAHFEHDNTGMTELALASGRTVVLHLNRLPSVAP
jgi:broad specificity phosphatase PhoE